jgi:hypothetical protein
MSWGGPGGLTGEAAEQEGKELQGYLDGWIERGVFRTGKIVWDPQEGKHWVEVNTANGHDRGWSADEFRGYIQGIADMSLYASREKKMALDERAHELAEKQRDFAEKQWPGDETPTVVRRVIAGRLADLIDPKVKTE